MPTRSTFEEINLKRPGSAIRQVRVVIWAYHLPMEGGARRRKLPLWSYVNKPISRNLYRKNSSKECLTVSDW